MIAIIQTYFIIGFILGILYYVSILLNFAHTVYNNPIFTLGVADTVAELTNNDKLCISIISFLISILIMFIWIIPAIGFIAYGLIKTIKPPLN